MQDEFELRIRRLERRQRALIGVVALAAVPWLILVALGARWWSGERSLPFEVRAPGFSVEHGGRTVAHLEVDALGAGRLRLLDGNGRPCLRLGDHAGKGGVVDVHVPTGERRARFGMADSGRPMVGLGNADGQTIASLGTTPDGSATLALNTPNGGPMVLIRTTDLSLPRVELYAPDGARAAFLESNVGGGALRLYGPEQHELVYLGRSEHGAGFVGTYDPAGAITAAMGQVKHGLGGFVKAFGLGGDPLFCGGADVDGDGVVSIFTRDGRKLFALGPDLRNQGGVINVHDVQGSMVARWPDWP